MSENDKPEIKYCVYCGEELEPGEIYCPNCGKLVVKPKSSQSSEFKSPDIRKCPNCGTLIQSSVLKECPICRTKLKEPPRPRPKKPEQKQGLVFTDDKLEPEEKYILRKENWQIKEGMAVLYTSIFFYFIILSFFIFFPLGDNIYNVLISTASEIVIGLYPIWYIYSNKHSIKKLGLIYEKEKLLPAILIGLIGGLALLVFDWLIGFIVQYMVNFFGVSEIIQESVNIILNTEFYWLILLMFLYIFTSLSKEILFRGVLHNTLIERFGDDLSGKIIVITIVSLAYSLLFLLFRFPLGLLYFLPYFIMNFSLGVIYELSNRNLFCTITASILYNISSLILLLIL
ncbi:MAG: CPBP family intramembrane metalloprotease [Promethearchaeota archaeon]|nr:MAG: CPBP family intramembrane metalloprotease [Candidatus Lokiarchaeota archaeon]